MTGRRHVDQARVASPLGVGKVSDRVSWEICPSCGGRIAIGWSARDTADGPVAERPVEYDCSAGCHLTLAELRAFAELQPRKR